MLDLDEHGRLIIVKESMYWDSHKATGCKMHIYSSTIRQNAEVLQALATTVGMKTYCRKNNGGMWVLSIKRNVKSRGGNLLLSELPHTGDVAVLSVPSTFVLVRSGGIPVVCGQTINFGIIYGITADGLYRNMIVVKGCEHWTVALAQQYIDQYFTIRPGIQGYVDETTAMARRYGKVWDWAGRIRRIPGARLKSEYHRAEAERQACNARIQGGAQSIIKKAMVKLQPVYEGFRAMGYACSPMIQIHDDIVSMVSVDLLPLLVPVQKEIMETVRPLKAGCKVDVEIGEKWGELRKWEQ
jgi:hypothetical protein